MNHAMAYFDKVAEYNDGAEPKARIESSIYKPNADCVTALRARFYLYEHKFDQAIEEAKTIAKTTHWPVAQTTCSTFGSWTREAK